MVTAITRPIRHAVAVVAVLAAAAGYACASGGKGNPLPPVNIEVQNNLPTPTDATVYLNSGGGIRQMLGFVPGGETKTFTFQPTSTAQQYRLEAVRQLARTIRSQPFTVGDEMTGTIQWTLFPNIVGFRERDVVETTYVDTTKKKP